MTIRYIYGLFDPRYDCVRYIGMANDPWQRTFGRYRPGSWWHSHWSTALYTDADGHKNNWLRQLDELGLQPKLVILEFGEWTREETFAKEIEWIAMCRAHGENLTNVSGGGDGWGVSRVYTEEMRKNTSEASKRSWTSLTEEERKERSKRMHENIDWTDPEYKARLSAGVKASWDRMTSEERSARAQKTLRVLTPEQRRDRALKAAETRRRNGTNTGPAISAALKGKKWSEERKAAHKKSIKDVPNHMQNEESRKKIGDANRKRWQELTPEQRAVRSANMSAAQKKRQVREREQRERA